MMMLQPRPHFGDVLWHGGGCRRCGEEHGGQPVARSRCNIRFFMIAMMMLVTDAGMSVISCFGFFIPTTTLSCQSFNLLRVWMDPSAAAVDHHCKRNAR